MSEILLLDTCTFFWLASDPKQLSSKARLAIESEDSILALSAISAWELALKESIGALVLKGSLDEFIKSIISEYQIELKPISMEACAQLKKLPNPHKDPFDRMLICEAIVSGATIVSPDEMIARYPIRVLW